MIATGTLLTFALATAVASVIPGPTVAVITVNAMSEGRRSALMTVFGAELAVISMIGVITFGLQAVVALMGDAFNWIKLLGAAYLIWIGWKTFHAKPTPPGELKPDLALVQSKVLQGFLIVWSNPKTLLFLGAFLPQFVAPDQPAMPQILILGAIVLAVASLNDLGYALLASGLRRQLNAARLRVVTRLSGAALMASGVWLAMQRRI